MAYDVERNWITAAGLRAVVIVCRDRRTNLRSHRCGYIGLPLEHALYGVKATDQVPTIKQEDVDSLPLGKRSLLGVLAASAGGDEEGLISRSPDVLFDVHGGLTYSTGAPQDNDYPVSSSPQLFWYGFDCAHYGDGKIEGDDRLFQGPARSLAYVSDECERLAEQLAAFDARVKKAARGEVLS